MMGFSVFIRRGRGQITVSLGLSSSAENPLMRRQPSTSQKENPHQGLNWLHLESPIS